MSDDRDSMAAPLPDKARIIQELHSGIQLNELKDEGPTAPSYEEAISSSYPVLPVESTSMQRAQPPMHHQSPPYHSPPPVVSQPQHVQTIVHHQNPPVGPTPASIQCPSCKQHVITNVNFVSSTKTHLMALLLCLFGCWCCVCCPYCMDECQHGNHTCPKCGAYVGTYNN